MISQNSSNKISQHSKADMQSRKSLKIISPNKNQASFRFKTTNRNVWHVLNLMKAMMSEQLSLFYHNFQMFIFKSPKTQMLLGKIAQRRSNSLSSQLLKKNNKHKKCCSNLLTTISKAKENLRFSKKTAS